jgi:hypothetical protein
MILLLFYAVFSWYFAARWRRTWKGFASQAASVLLVIGVIQSLRMIDTHGSDEPGRFMSFQIVLAFEAAIIALVGTMICCLPKPPPSPWQCRLCKYDLAGLTRSTTASPAPPDAPDAEHVPVTCPECGALCILHIERPVELIPIPRGRAKPDGQRR